MAVAVEFSSDNAKLLRGMAQLEKKTEDLKRKLAEVGKTGRKAGDDTARSMKKATEQGFGGSALTKVGAFALKLGSVTTAVAGITAGLRFMQSESAAALNTLRSLGDARRRLNQIATSPEDLRALDERSSSLSKEFGVKPNVVKNLIFSARSEGFEPSVDFILRNKQVIDVATQATLAGQIPGLFPGSGLTSKESINLALVAAQQSRLNVEQITSGLPSVSTGAGLAGSSPEETFALLSVLAGRLASGQQAADRGKAFGTKVGITPGFQGLGIVGAFKKLQGGTEEDRRKFLGESQELNVFFSILETEIGEVEKRTRELEGARLRTGTPESAIMLARERARQSPKFQALDLVERSDTRREIAREDALADERAVITAIRNNSLAIIDELGGSGARKALTQGVQAVTEFVGGGPQAVGVAGSIASSMFTSPTAGMIDPVAAAILDMTEATIAAAQAQEATAEKMGRVADRMERALGGGPALSSDPNVNR